MQYGKLSADSAPKVYLAAVLLGVFFSVPLLFVEGEASVFLGYALPQLCYLAAIFGFLKLNKIQPSLAIPVRKKLHPVALLLCFAVTAGLFAQNLLPAVSFQWLLQAMGVNATVVLPDFTKPATLILGVFIICILPAMGEEMMFRGVALHSFRPKGQATAVLLSAALFSLSHGNPAQLVHQFFLGIVLAYLTLQTGTILYAMIIHFTNNLLAVVLPLLLPAFDGLAVCTPTNALILAAICIVGICVLYPSLSLLTKKAGGKQGFFGFFKKNAREACYNIDDETEMNPAANNRSSERIWLVALFIFMVIQLAVNTLLTAIPTLGQLLP